MAQLLFLTALIFVWPTLASAQPVQKNFYSIQQEMEELYKEPGSRDAKYKHWKRAEYYLQTRLGSKGEIVSAEHLKWSTWEKHKAQLQRGPQRTYSGDWEFFGPFLIEENPGIGRVNRIAFHPSDPDIIYLGTAGGGVQYTNNHGIDWAPLTESLPVNNISGIVVDHTDPDLIYILTGDGDGCCGGARGYFLRKSSTGILKSVNGGYTWQPTGLIFEEDDEVWPYDLVQHPVLPEILLAATSTGIFLSVDAGQDWTQVLNSKVFELHFKPDQPSVIFAVSDEYVFRSTTVGITWDSIAIPLLDGDDGRMSLAICDLDPDVMYLAASPDSDDSTSCRGFFQSTDAGLSFDFVIDTPNIVDYQPNYDLAMICNPQNINQVLVGAVRHWKTTNAGSSFAKLDGTHADIHDLKVNPLNNRLYSANDGGLYYSDDFGENWIFMAEYCAITQYYKLAVSQQNPEVVIAGAQDNGTHRNHENASQDMDKIHGGDGMDCAIHPSNDSLMIYSSQDGDFWLSSDLGNSEDSLIHRSSLPDAVKASWVTAIGWDPSDADNIYIGYKPIYRSFDRGATFDPIPDTVSGRRILHVATANGQRLYAGDLYKITEDVNTFHLWTSSDQGTTWTPLHTSNTFPDTFLVISALCTHPDDDQEVWITVAGYVDGIKVFRSLDAGTTWTNMSGTLPNTTMNTIVLQNTQGSSNYAVYLGTDIGIFYRDASLGDWIPFSNGLPIVEISDLEINHADGRIVASTHGRGIWIADLFSSCENVINISYSLQNDDHSYFFQASDSIISNVPVDNSFGVQVIYKAAHAVVLKEGFQATQENGSYFRALLGDCEEGGVIMPRITTDAPVPVEVPFPKNKRKRRRT